jgi:hypothetical protein
LGDWFGLPASLDSSLQPGIYFVIVQFFGIQFAGSLDNQIRPQICIIFLSELSRAVIEIQIAQRF